MSSEFRKFGDAARLYANNAKVVDRMREAYQTDVGAFLDTLNERIAELVQPRTLQQRTMGRVYYNWWLGKDTHDDDEHPCLWIDPTLPRIVVPGILHVTVDISGKMAAYGEQFSAVQSQLQLPSSCSIEKGEQDGIFTVIMRYETEDDPVTFIAGQIASLLIALDAVEKKLNDLR